MSTRRAVLEGLIDYAGLFPPAGLGMSDTVRNFAAYQRRPDSWALARLVVPVSRLAEFEQALDALPEVDRLGTRWPITALLGVALEPELGVVSAFNQRHVHGGPRVVSLEARVESEGQVTTLRSTVSPQLELFVELPLGGDMPALVAAVKREGARAKIRTGGVHPGDIPDPHAVLAFLERAAATRIPFKATAGLHHPVRGSVPLTYAPGSARATMFGYLNLVLAASALWQGLDGQTAFTLLTSEDPKTLRLGEDEVSWAAIHLSREAIVAARHEFVLAIGSCSFTEPLEELAGS
jgi:hypothetical protein